MEPLSETNCYKTPGDMPRNLGMKIFSNNRLRFYSKFLRVVRDYRSICVRNLGTDEKWVDASRRILKDIEMCGGQFSIEGFDNLREAHEPVVVISNHMSAMETMIFPVIIFPFFPITFVVKESLTKGFVFGPIMRSRSPIAVGRVNPRKDFETVLVEGTKILEKGISIVIFPQATRRVVFDPEAFNTLGIKLAKRAGVKVVPAAIKTDFWGNNKKFLKDFGPVDPSKKIYMSFGEPMTIEGNGKEQHGFIVEFIRSHLEQWMD